jgi:hypothetical protein
LGVVKILARRAGQAQGGRKTGETIVCAILASDVGNLVAVSVKAVWTQSHALILVEGAFQAAGAIV